MDAHQRDYMLQFSPSCPGDAGKGLEEESNRETKQSDLALLQGGNPRGRPLSQSGKQHVRLL